VCLYFSHEDGTEPTETRQENPMNTTASRYEIPAKVTVSEAHTVEIRNVKRGDVMNGATVGDVRTGPKYVRVFDADGKQIASAATDQETLTVVVRDRETPESVEARRRAINNEAIEDRVAEETAKGPQPRTLAALAGMTEEVTNGYHVNHVGVGGLMTAQAKDTLWARFISMVDYNFSDEAAARDDFTPVDHVGVLERFRSTVADLLLGSHDLTGGLSRSTSMVANLMNDAEREAYAEFYRRTEHGGIIF